MQISADLKGQDSFMWVGSAVCQTFFLKGGVEYPNQGARYSVRMPIMSSVSDYSLTGTATIFHDFPPCRLFNMDVPCSLDRFACFNTWEKADVAWKHRFLRYRISHVWCGRVSYPLYPEQVYMTDKLDRRNMTTMIAGRAVAGVGGGGILCLSMINIADLIPRAQRFVTFFMLPLRLDTQRL